jgi:hypothetical protein
VIRYDAAYQCVGPPEGQVGLRMLRDWALSRWRGQISDLGIYNCRYVRGGGTLSVHANGRAWDCRWSRRDSLDAYFLVLVQHADALGVQRMIDYHRQRIWTTGKGWQSVRVQSPGGLASHVERNWDGALDARPIDRIIGYVPQVDSSEEDDVGFLPVREPKSKAGPNPKAGNRTAGYQTSGTKILGVHGAALAGDRALDGTDAVAAPPKTEVRVLQTKSAAKLVDLFYWVDDAGKVHYDQIGAYAADYGTFGPFQCT